LLKYALKRIVNLIPVLLAITFLVFLLMYITPGDPALMRLASSGGNVTAELLEATRQEMGLNDPFFTRYFKWVGNIVFHLDFGNSYADDLPILPKLWTALKQTLKLAAASTVFSAVVAIPVGVYTAINKDKWLDNVVRIFTFVGNAGACNF